MKRSIGLAALVAFAVGGNASAASPPIDCHKARGAVDRDICASGEFLAMDREATALYDRGMAAFSPDDRHHLADSQLAYLKRRSGCAWAAHNSAHPGVAIEECLRGTMEGRLHGLRLAVDRGRY